MARNVIHSLDARWQIIQKDYCFRPKSQRNNKVYGGDKEHNIHHLPRLRIIPSSPIPHPNMQAAHSTKRPRQPMRPAFLIAPLRLLAGQRASTSALPCAPLRVLRPRQSRPHAALSMCASQMPRDESEDEELLGDGSESMSADDSSDELKVFRKGKLRRVSGDLLPFDISIVSPPPMYLGRFQLDPYTHCGDVVEHNGHQFVVKRVRVQYKFSGGGYHVFRKKIEVKSLARKALESYLEKVWSES